MTFDQWFEDSRYDPDVKQILQEAWDTINYTDYMVEK